MMPNADERQTPGEHHQHRSGQVGLAQEAEGRLDAPMVLALAGQTTAAIAVACTVSV